MLTPDYYEDCADDIIELYAQLDEAIIADITRRIIKTGTITETAKWQIKQAQEMGLLYDDIISEIGRRTNATDAHVRALFEDAGVRTVQYDAGIYHQAGLVPVDIRQSPAMMQVLNAGYKKTLGKMRELTGTTAVTSQTAYINACNNAYMKITSGAFSYQEAIKQAIQTAAQQGSTVLYPSGHIDRLDVAVRRAVLTGVGQTCRTISETNAGEMGCDLMEISAHSGARPSHAEWQGQIVSLSGRKGYLNKDAIGYGTGAGFGGYNCQHDWYPYFEGISTRNYNDKMLKQMNAKCIEYNNKMYSEYEISQIQRRMEREIRSAKREKVAYQTAVSESSGELKGVMQKALAYSKSDVSDKQAKMRDFINQTGQQRQYFREQNYGRVAYSNDSTQYMSRFNPRYSNNKNIKTGTLNIPVKTISNSKFVTYTDISATRKDKAVRQAEKLLEACAKNLPKNFKMPEIAVVNFENNKINANAIGGYDKNTGIMYINSKYNTKEKILAYVNAVEGQFANKTEYAPVLHELGHKYYEDCINSLAISKNMSYNDVKKEIDRKIYNYIESHGGNEFLAEELSKYAKKGYTLNQYTEIIAECFSVQNNNDFAKELLHILSEGE